MKVGQPSFTSGEIDPSLHARADLPLYKTALETCLNYIIMPQGGARNRTGTAYRGATRNNNQARLVAFAYNDDDSYLLEFTEYRFRVYRNGSQVLLPSTPAAWVTATAYSYGDFVSNGGTNYSCRLAHTSAATDEPGVGANWEDYWIALEDDIVELYQPFTYAQLQYMDYDQSADTLVLTHSSAYPLKLTRSDHHVWDLTTPGYAPSTAAPTGLSGSGGTGTTYTYVVTAVNAETLEESVASASTTMAEDGGTLTWTDVAGAGKYNVYKQEQGIFGFIGQSSDGTTGFTDAKYIAETEDTPPVARDPFASTAKYPSAVAWHEQRLCFGGANPQRINTSQVGTYFNFSVSEPASDGDALTLDVVTNKVADIRYLISQIDLLVFTAGAEVRVTSHDSAFVLDNLSRKTQSAYGCQAGVKPQVVGDKILFVQRGGTAVRDFAYSLEADKFTGGDLSIIAKHLFSETSVVRWAYVSEPEPIVWMVTTAGKLIGMTIAPEHEVLAFHQHELADDGVVEDVVTVPEGDTTAVYFVVKRTKVGSPVRYIEKLSTWVGDPTEDATFLDCHSTGTITGSKIINLDHLEAKNVTALIDGDVVSNLNVASGEVTLPRTYTNAKACVGLPYVSRLKTLEPPIQDAYGNEMSVSRLQLRVLKTRGIWAGPDEDNMTEYPTRLYEDWGDPATTHTGVIEIVIEPTWSGRGKVVVEQPDPLPSFILALVPDVETGG